MTTPTSPPKHSSVKKTTNANAPKLANPVNASKMTTTATDKPQSDPNFKPEFSKYDVVISNFGFGAAPWPEETQAAFDKYVSGGGGLVIVHAADNSFGEWDAYNKMIGIGGWGGRNEKHGPYI